MKIAFLPIDNRPVCYSLAKDICAVDKDTELLIPNRELLGDLTKPANTEELLQWLNNIPRCDAVILSLDTLVYGGLIPSRRSAETLGELKLKLDKIKNILKEKKSKIYAFSSIMRISNNNYNEEEKEYWKDYGKRIFEFSYKLHKDGYADSDIPQEIIEDYLKTRERNFEVNKIYLEWQKEGLFDTLIFSKDDCAEYGLNVREAQELEKMGGYTKTGADEIPLSLLSRSIEKDIKIFVQYTEPDCKDLISNYEDVSIEKSVSGQLELGGFTGVNNKEDADIVLIVNNFREKQGELVMGWSTQPFDKIFTLPTKPYAVADVRYANGADNAFVEKLLNILSPSPRGRVGVGADCFFGYAGWNTSANTLGSLLAGVKVKFNAKKYSEDAFKKLQMVRFLDDWAYQANVRGQIDKPCDISELMKPYEERLSKILEYKIPNQITYHYPWNRKFETEVLL